MKKHTLSLSITALSFCFAGLVHAQAPTPQQSYKEAVAHCATLSGDAQTNCKRDAYAAHNDKNRNHIAPDMQTLEQNRTARCNKLPESQRQECLEQMQGVHKTEVYGSVKGGGRLRQTTIETQGEPYQVTKPASESTNVMPRTPRHAPSRSTITPIQ